MRIAVASLDRKLMRELWQRRGQVFAIALVIAAAVATLVTSLSAPRSLSDARDAFYERHRFAQVFVRLSRAPEALADRLRAIDGVAQVDTRVARGVTLEVKGDADPLRGTALSLPPDNARALNGLELRRGRWPDARRGNEVLVHEAFATAHGFAPGAHFTALMNGHRQQLVVAGIALSPELVYVIGPGDLVPDDRHYGVFWMARDALAATMDYRGAFNDAALSLRYGASVDAVIASVDTLLAPYGGSGAFARDQQISHAFLDSEFGQLRTMASVIPPIFLLVSAFLLYTVMSRQIETQREEVGLLKAFGYSDAAVAWHFLKFALAISVIGLVLGWAAGAWLGRAMTQMYGNYFRFPALQYGMALDILLLSGAVASISACAGAVTAARRAAQLAPAVAMSPPVPAAYGRGLFERLGLERGVTVVGHMILRHITRFPLRAGMTVTGIALSLALLVSTLQFFDAIDVLIDSYFFQAQRQDVTLHFVDMRPERVQAEVQRLPGVLRSELRRSVDVRLRHGSRSRRAVLQGIDADARLSVLRDASGNSVTLPPSGVVLSARLALHLGVAVGDTLDVQVQGGRRAQRSVRVARIVDEYVGLAAYMDRAALNRLTGDGPVTDGAWLQVDAQQEPALFRAVQHVPGIFTVNLQRQAYAKFRQLLDENIGMTLGFYVGFAAVIAFGVAYNASRITLSERARELATLRVLGYQKREVALVLLGELALLTLAALPLGCLLGYALSKLMIALFTTDLYQMPFALAPRTYGWSALVVLVATAVSCASVVWRVQQLDLVRVLKARD